MSSLVRMAMDGTCECTTIEAFAGAVLSVVERNENVKTSPFESYQGLIIFLCSPTSRGKLNSTKNMSFILSQSSCQIMEVYKVYKTT